MLKKAPMLLALFSVIGLAACAAQQEAKLEGVRKNILATSSSLQPDTSVYSEPLLLPKSQPNADWSQVGGNASHFMKHMDMSENVRAGWKRRIGRGSSDSSILLNPPVAAGGVVYGVNTEGEIHAVNAETGKKMWEYEIELKEEDQTDFSAGLAFSEGVLFVTTATGEVLALNVADQSVKWTADIGVPVRAAPSVADGKVFVVGHNNSLYVLDEKDGALAWTHNGIEEELAIIGGAPPAVADGVVVVPYSSGEIYALNAKDGRYMWHDALSVNVGSDPYSSLVDVEASPVIADGLVYAVNHNGRLTAFDLKTGRRYWSREISATQMPWVVGNAIYIVTESGQLACLHRQDGRIRWVQNLAERLDEDEEGGYWVGPIMAGGRLIMTTDVGYALAIDPFKGKVRKVVELPEGVSLAPLVAGGRLIFMTEDARLVSFK